MNGRKQISRFIYGFCSRNLEIMRWNQRSLFHYYQLERSATSIGANIREAKYAHSKPDFISKLQISLKECYETEYWLELMQKAEILPDVSILMHNCGVIRKILISSINAAKKNNS